MKRGVLICFFLILAMPRPYASSDTFRITPAGIQRIWNSAPSWRFNVGENKAYADPDFNDSSWQRLSVTRVNKELRQQYGIKPESKIWFRTFIQLEESLLFQPLMMQFDGNGKMMVYLDGNLISTIEDTASQAENKNVKLARFPVYIPIVDTLCHVLAIQYSNDFKDNRLLGFGFKVKHARDALEEFNEEIGPFLRSILALASLFSTLFIVHLLLFLFYRKDLSNLYFAIFNLSISTLLFTVYYYVNSYKSWYADGNMAFYLLSGSMLTGCFSIVAFVNYLFGRRKKIARIIMAMCVIAYLIVLATDNTTSGIGDLAADIAAVVALAYMLAMFIKAMIKKVPGSRILSFGFLLLTFFIVGIVVTLVINKGSLEFNNEYTGILLILLLYLAILSIPFSITSFLAWRFAHVNKNLNMQLITVEKLSHEKHQLLEEQNVMLEQQVTQRTQELQLEKQKADNLLLNILPQEVAEELKENGKSKAQYFDNVSVLFTDFVNFTAISQQMGVDELLNELNANFTAFDEIMDRYGLEKIKTIGDAYLAVCGLPVANPEHAINSVNAALEILHFVEKRKTITPYALDIRIGIHSGPVAAGIIGVKKFAYDIWGDTVNTAARMEQNGEAGRINISESTFQLVKHRFNCIHRGRINAKGKGAIDMYFVSEH